MDDLKEVNPILPVPRHLRNIFQADIEHSNEHDLKGSICCDCGCKSFHIKIFANFDSNHIPHVCRYKDGITVPDEELKIFACQTCKADFFEINMSIEAEYKEQFIQEVIKDEPDKFSVEDYIDAFNGIGLDIRCRHCGAFNKNWIALETS